MEAWAKTFYLSQEWRRAREDYLKKTGYLCERCLKMGMVEPAVMVHHRIYLTPENINDPEIRTGDSNLEALCFSCHEKEHKGKKRYLIDANGKVVARD